MLRHTLKIRWAGPAVAVALLAAALPARAGAAAAPARPQVLTYLVCADQAAAFGHAVATWVNAYNAYQNALPGGTSSEIQQAVDQLNGATDQVVRTGTSLLNCLGKLLQ